ncbi:MAG: hypothetical protein B7Y36_08195 [Novosphingobium sp. 28-62-57]|uniref:phage tail fiber domain-containing protein n=1 Tax=unclassified Novosphingobium TaxID=2644732 RepID=UPI000BCA0EAA|nr:MULTISPECIES: phage tail fiber protein [unclassified Novosphingobium]OYW47905.1 MAG: hypothetical protein B7Z36_01290 [Novosphingobium sp. 12-63-9]OYZ10796.1 MAG: hypothetical protein B7Y36_08195 [Novosphingobium sp. 28-62-57]OZA31083.1 MAG: hypothetical protein B7X92_15250 [Novosphingobium sp. 17-62-9]HQS71027.1 phage tail fiber protein [Novosphingobium sp.]
MTVAAEIPLALYDGDGVTVAFPAPWRYLDTAHLLVEVINADGVATAKVLGTHYTATAGPTDAGGTVTMITAPAADESLSIRRVTPLSQPTAYPTAGAFPAASHELALDRLMMVSQEQSRELARAPKVPAGAASPNLADLSGAAQNSVLAYDTATQLWRPVGVGDWEGWRDSAITAITDEGDSQVERVNEAGAIILDAAAAVKQVFTFGTYQIVEGAWYFTPGIPFDTDLDTVRFFLTGSGTLDLYINAADNNIIGPLAVTTADGEDAVTVFVPRGSRMSFQIDNITGEPTALLGSIEGFVAA